MVASGSTCVADAEQQDLAMARVEPRAQDGNVAIPMRPEIFGSALLAEAKCSAHLPDSAVGVHIQRKRIDGEPRREIAQTLVGMI